MKKAAILAGIVLLVLALGQCSLFTTEIKYLVTSGDISHFGGTSMRIGYGERRGTVGGAL